MPHHSSRRRSHRSHRAHRKSRKANIRPTLKRNAFRIVNRHLSKRPARSMRNIRYAVLPLLPTDRPSSHSSPHKYKMNLERTRPSTARQAKSAYQERKEAEALQREQERLQREAEKAERSALRHEKQEKKAAHAAAVSDLNDMFSRMEIVPKSHMHL